MHPTVEALESTVESWRSEGLPSLDLFLVSGSGLEIDLGAGQLRHIPLLELLPFPVDAVDGHTLTLTLYRLPDGPVLAYQRGRLHAYQGLTADQIVFTVRFAALLGARTLIATNAAGGIRKALHPGRLVLITDHLNLTGMNPLVGDLPEAWGPRFPDMSQAYDPALLQAAEAAGAELEIPLSRGVYAGLLGPSYETPAEVEMLRRLGADLVGMSTVLEIIAARQIGLRCLVLSLVTNLAAGLRDTPLDHQEVLDAGAEARDRQERLIAALLERPELVSS